MFLNIFLNYILLHSLADYAKSKRQQLMTRESFS